MPLSISRVVNFCNHPDDNEVISTVQITLICNASTESCTDKNDIMPRNETFDQHSHIFVVEYRLDTALDTTNLTFRNNCGDWFGTT